MAFEEPGGLSELLRYPNTSANGLPLVFLSPAYTRMDTRFMLVN